MLNTTRRPQFSLTNEIRLFGFQQFIRLTRWLRTMSGQWEVIRDYAWVPVLTGLVGILWGYLSSLAR